jgi:LuxR family transcriptional regulator, maltose regulon positive regulatory protein
MHVGVSQLDRERDDLEAARQHVLASQQLGEHKGLPQNPYRLRVAMARIRETEGDLEGTLELLEEAARRYTSDFGPKVRPIATMKA